jgi:arylsulfatase A-like enzyme
LTGYIDVYPTLRQLAGQDDAPLDGQFDGRDVWPMLTGEAAPADRAWYSFIAMNEPESIAVHSDPWKLIVRGPSVLTADAAVAEDYTVMLFHLDDDPYETTNLAAEHPEVVARLWPKLREFRRLKVDVVGAMTDGEDTYVPPETWEIGNTSAN